MQKGLRSIMPLSPDSLRGVEPNAIASKRPKFEWVDPRTIYVEEAYQRDIAESGIAMIRRIVAGFSWERFKPPIVVRDEEAGVLVAIDGQHTAIAAASHPKIDKIPVMIVEAADVAARAASFVGHNRDRIALTAMAIFYAELTAGDPLAQAVQRACKRARVIILKQSINLKNKTPVGGTIAIGTLKALVSKPNGEAFLGRVLNVLVAAGRGPIKASEIRATALVLEGCKPEADERLAEIVKSRSPEAWMASVAEVVAEAGGKPEPEVAQVWRGLLFPSHHVAPSDAPKPPSPAKPIPPKPVTPPISSVSPKAALQLKQVAESRPGPKAPPLVINGISIDATAKALSHRGREVEIPMDGLLLVAALARGMPGWIPPEIVAKKVWKKPLPDLPGHVAQLAARTNPKIEAVRLQIKTVPKMGYMLADLGEPQGLGTTGNVAPATVD